MNFIDMHIHLQDYKSIIAKNVVTAAKQSGIKKMVCASIVEEDWEKIGVYTDTYPKLVVPAFGLHPWYLEGAEMGWEDRIADLFTTYPQALVGETGIDGISKTPLDLQKKMFETHVNLAKQFGRPLIIHAVKAGQVWDEYWSMLPEKFMFHSYNASPEQLYHINRIGGYVSFSNSIMANKDAEKIIDLVPANRLLLETDGPYQSGIKGVESGPQNLPTLFEFVAKLKKIDTGQIYQNSLEFLK